MRQVDGAKAKQMTDVLRSATLDDSAQALARTSEKLVEIEVRRSGLPESHAA